MNAALLAALPTVFTADVPRDALPADDVTEIVFSTINVRGLKSSYLELARHLEQVQPLLCVVTETKLHVRRHKDDFVKDSSPGYERFISSYKHKAEEASVDPHTGGVRELPKAGVMIAVRADFAQQHLVTKVPVPTCLEGFLVHLRFMLPASTPLHVMGVYNPCSEEQHNVQERLLAHVAMQATNIEKDCHRLLLGGDWNATLHLRDRYSAERHAHVQTTKDFSFRETLAKAQIGSVFVNPHDRQHSWFAQS